MRASAPDSRSQAGADPLVLHTSNSADVREGHGHTTGQSGARNARKNWMGGPLQQADELDACAAAGRASLRGPDSVFAG